MPADRFVVGVALGRWQTNCYLVGDRAAGGCVAVDPGEGAAAAVPELLNELGVACEAILLTHGHLDHLWGVPALAQSLEVPVHLHPDDRWLWDDPLAGLGALPDTAAEALLGAAWDPPDEHLADLADRQVLRLAGSTFEVRHTPGHTPGSVTFLAEDLAGAPVDFALARRQRVPPDGMLLSGDLIFARSVGRTDLPRGSTSQLLDAIVRTVLPLPDDTLILSGHGPDTTVGAERRTNPFVVQARRTAS